MTRFFGGHFGPKFAGWGHTNIFEDRGAGGVGSVGAGAWAVCLQHHFLIKLTIRLVWRINDHSGEDVTEEVIQETNQEDSWTPEGQVWG